MVRQKFLSPCPPAAIGSASGLFPVRLCRKRFAGPGCIRPGIIPADKYHRLHGLTPVGVIQQHGFTMSGTLNKFPILKIGNRITVHVISSQINLAGRRFSGIDRVFSTIQHKYLKDILMIQAHGKFTGRYENHFGTINGSDQGIRQQAEISLMFYIPATAQFGDFRPFRSIYLVIKSGPPHLSRNFANYFNYRIIYIKAIKNNPKLIQRPCFVLTAPVGAVNVPLSL